MNEKGKTYVPFLCSILLFLGVSNTIGIFGIAPAYQGSAHHRCPGSYEYSACTGGRNKGEEGQRVAQKLCASDRVMLPMNILELFIKPLSLCMRLFGNIFAAFVIMELVKMVVPVVLPAALCLYFDLFDGLLQAYVFVFLTSLVYQ